jgi:hypothetical protein
MRWRRALLSLALVGGCIWCLGLVEQVHSEQNADPQQAVPTAATPAPAATAANGLVLQPSPPSAARDRSCGQPG